MNNRCAFPSLYFSVALFLVAAASLAHLLAYPARAEQSQPAPSVQPTQRDVTYCTTGGVSLKLDIYEREHGTSQSAKNKHRPAVMFVHGGSWSAGDKAGGEGEPEIGELVSRGYLVVSINYRLAPSYVFPSQIADVKCAVRYLRANAAALNIDPQKIGAWGASAGGHLVSLLGTAGPEAGLEGDGGYSGQSSRVQAVVDMYGRADLATVPQTRPDLLPIFGSETDLAKYSPVTYVSADDPPFLILHGDKDATVPPELSQEFYGKLKAAGVHATLVMVKNAGHGFYTSVGAISPPRSEITRIVADFFDSQLRGGASSGASASGTPGKVVATPAATVVGSEPLPPGGDTLTCTQTGKSVRGKFLDYWNSHGSVMQMGYPISGELQESSILNGKSYTVQYFERVVLEYHPENQPPYDVLQALLGAERYKQKYPGPGGAPGQRPNNSEDSVFFVQTGHRVGGVFLSYWQQHGGVAQQGFPVSDELTEKSPVDGKLYTMQYFERVVLEYHPEFKGTAGEVLPSQLGRLKYDVRERTIMRVRAAGPEVGLLFTENRWSHAHVSAVVRLIDTKGRRIGQPGS